MQKSLYYLCKFVKEWSDPLFGAEFRAQQLRPQKMSKSLAVAVLSMAWHTLAIVYDLMYNLWLGIAIMYDIM